MGRSWQLQEAKAKFSQVVAEAQTHGPQVVTRHGKEVAVVISFEEYRRSKQTSQSLYEFFRNSPLVGLDLDFSRDKSLPREIDFDIVTSEPS